MTILFCADQYLPAINGITMHMKLMKEELEKRGHRVLIAAGTHDKKQLASVKDFFELPSFTFPGRKEDLITIPTSKRIERLLLTENIDVIHDHLFSTSVLAARIAQKKNIPHLVTYHTMFPYLVHRMLPILPTKITTWISYLVSRMYFRQFDLILAPSQKAVLTLKSSGSKAPIRVHYNGIPLALFMNATPHLFEKTYPLDPSTRLIIMAGRVDAGKNIPLAIRAFSQIVKDIPNITLVILGDGVEMKKSQVLVQELHIQDSVIFTGTYDRELLASACHRGDIALFTSVVDTLSTTAIEQATAGLPFVAVNDPGVTDIARENINAVITKIDEKEIAAGLKKLLTDEVLRKKYSVQSQKIAQEFTIETCVDGLEKIYQQEIDKKKDAR